MIHVLLALKSGLLRGALAIVLAQEDDMTVVAELADTGEVIESAKREQPNIAVLDHALPGAHTIEALCDLLVTMLPECAVLVTVDRRNATAISGALARLAPRVGLIATEVSPAALVDGIRKLSNGGPVLDPHLALAALAARENPLTEREREVLQLARDGLATKQIARHLNLSAGTVRNHLARILAKTNARTRLDAIRIAEEAGWI